MNTAGWVLLTVTFGGLLLLVQRTERKRRMVTLAIMIFVGLITWRYAIYRLSNDCDQIFRAVCYSNLVRQPALAIAYNTLNLSLLTAVMLNIVFWVLIGRSNPPGTSDAIQVYGMDD